MNDHPLSQFRFCPKCGKDGFGVNNAKSKRCPCCGFVYYFNPSSAVAAFITDGHGNILLARRGKEPAKGTLDLPGGFVDVGETAEQALVREVREETGITPHGPRYLFSIPNIYRYSGFDVHTVDMFFECSSENLRLAKPSDDVSGLKIVAVKDVDTSRIGLESVRKAMELYKKNN